MLQKFKGYLEKKEGEIIGIASTEAQDRDGEVILQSGWDLENFKKNPVILASHNYYEFPIGKATDIQVDNGKMIFKMVFSQATEKAKEAYQLVQEGILKSFSVGFIPREHDPMQPHMITKAELLEISLVTVPANPEALVLAKGMKDNRLAQQILKDYWIEKSMAEEEQAQTEEAIAKAEAEKAEAEKLEAEKAAELAKQETEENSDNSTTEVVEPTKSEVEGGETGEEKALNIKLLQKTVGYLQDLLHEAKTRKAGDKK